MRMRHFCGGTGRGRNGLSALTGYKLGLQTFCKPPQHPSRCVRQPAFPPASRPLAMAKACCAGSKAGAGVEARPSLAPCKSESVPAESVSEPAKPTCDDGGAEAEIKTSAAKCSKPKSCCATKERGTGAGASRGETGSEVLSMPTTVMSSKPTSCCASKEKQGNEPGKADPSCCDDGSAVPSPRLSKPVGCCKPRPGQEAQSHILAESEPTQMSKHTESKPKTCCSKSAATAQSDESSCKKATTDENDGKTEKSASAPAAKDCCKEQAKSCCPKVEICTDADTGSIDDGKSERIRHPLGPVDKYVSFRYALRLLRRGAPDGPAAER